MSSTYVTAMYLIDGQSFPVGCGCEFISSSCTYPAAATPYWTIVFTRADATTFTVSSSNVTVKQYA